MPQLQRVGGSSFGARDSCVSWNSQSRATRSHSGFGCDFQFGRLAVASVGAVALCRSTAVERRGALCRGVSAGFRQRRQRRRSLQLAGFTDALNGVFFRKSDPDPSAVPPLLQVMQTVYNDKILPLERAIQFARLSEAPDLTEAYFYAKPLVLVVGQYSTGKSTLITHLLRSAYPGVRIGPEPTTDRFVVVMSGPSRQVLPGFALCSDRSRPFAQLQRFGTGFMERFEGALIPESEAPILESLCMIDTPGVLSGDKQRVDRSYDFEGAIGWFAENADLVLVLFDPNKLDISDEFRRCLFALQRSERKVRLVLNKVNALNPFELVRVTGALMWSLSKVINTPEMPHVFVGSFKDEQEGDHSPELGAFMRTEESSLLKELVDVPLDNTTRKVNDLVRRGRLARCHALLIDRLAYMKGPFYRFGSRRRVQEIISDPKSLAEVCAAVAQQHGIPLRDFLPAETLSDKLVEAGDSVLRRVSRRLIEDAEHALEVEIPSLMERVSMEREHMRQAHGSDDELLETWLRGTATVGFDRPRNEDGSHGGRNS